MKRNAGIQYAGLPGVTKACVDAVMRLIQFGDQIRLVRILSRSSMHCLLLTANVDETIAIKTGFSSGYSGEGPYGLSLVLELLSTRGAEIEEYDVDQDVLDRVDQSSLTPEDLSKLEAVRPVRPSRWYDYVFQEHWQRRDRDLWRHFPPVMPFAIIDTRLYDLAIKFFEHPDESLLAGYRRLEDIVRTRTGVEDHGQKLFSQAFLGEKAKLIWDGLTSSEHAGRATLFTAVYAAYRNPRAHREQAQNAESPLGEFLLLNHLYLLERQAHDAVRDGYPDS